MSDLGCLPILEYCITNTQVNSSDLCPISALEHPNNPAFIIDEPIGGLSEIKYLFFFVKADLDAFIYGTLTVLLLLHHCINKYINSMHH